MTDQIQASPNAILVASVTLKAPSTPDVSRRSKVWPTVLGCVLVLVGYLAGSVECYLHLKAEQMRRMPYHYRVSKWSKGDAAVCVMLSSFWPITRAVGYLLEHAEDESPF